MEKIRSYLVKDGKFCNIKGKASLLCGLLYNKYTAFVHVNYVTRKIMGYKEIMCS